MSAKKQTAVIHASVGKRHVVGVKDLRVHITPDGSAWFAQGLELDYAAVGKTVEEVKRNFEEGLRETVKQHLRMHGSIERLLQIAPQEAWNEFQASDSSAKLSYSTLEGFDFGQRRAQKKKPVKPALPFEGIVYVESEHRPNAG